MILVTGGAGYIGSHVIKLLSRYGHDTVVIDNLSRGHREMVSTGEFIEGDLSDKDLLIKTMREKEIDSVIHFAASSLVGESEECPHQYYNNNLSNGINLLGSMLETGVKKIVFSSSAAVYGNPVHVPIKEDHPTEPTNVYGSTKLIIEGMLKKYFEAYGIRSVSLRYFNAAGADPDAMRRAIAAFRGIEHRIEPVREIGGVQYYNDSIATAPERTLAALRSFHEPIVLLAGGRDKHLPLEELAETIKARVHTLILFGEGADLLDAAMRRVTPPLPIILRCQNLAEAVPLAAVAARPGDVVLLSPAFTSYDQFRDFEERGREFKRMVNALPSSSAGVKRGG